MSHKLKNNYQLNNCLKNYNKVIILYGAQWCHACSDIKSFYNRIAEKYSNKIRFTYIDIDVNKIKLDAIPLFVTYYKGKKYKQLIGSDKIGLKNLIKDFIKLK